MSDLLVETSGGYQEHHLTLTRRQQIEAFTQAPHLRALGACFAVGLQRLPDGGQQIVLSHWLCEEMHCASLESLHRHGNIAMAG